MQILDNCLNNLENWPKKIYVYLVIFVAMIPPHCPLQSEAKEDHDFCNGDCTSAKTLIKKFPYSFSDIRTIPHIHEV